MVIPSVSSNLSLISIVSRVLRSDCIRGLPICTTSTHNIITHRQTIMEASEAAATGPAALQGACSEGSKVRNLDFNDVIDIFAKSKARKAVF